VQQFPVLAAPYPHLGDGQCGVDFLAVGGAGGNLGVAAGKVVVRRDEA
jgi:hypothetical protein